MELVQHPALEWKEQKPFHHFTHFTLEGGWHSFHIWCYDDCEGVVAISTRFLDLEVLRPRSERSSDSQSRAPRPSDVFRQQFPLGWRVTDIMMILTWFMNSKSFRWIIDNFPLHYIVCFQLNKSDRKLPSNLLLQMTSSCEGEIEGNPLSMWKHQ